MSNMGCGASGPSQLFFERTVAPTRVSTPSTHNVHGSPGLSCGATRIEANPPTISTAPTNAINARGLTSLPTSRGIGAVRLLQPTRGFPLPPVPDRSVMRPSHRMHCIALLFQVDANSITAARGGLADASKYIIPGRKRPETGPKRAGIESKHARNGPNSDYAQLPNRAESPW